MAEHCDLNTSLVCAPSAQEAVSNLNQKENIDQYCLFPLLEVPFLIYF